LVGGATSTIYEDGFDDVYLVYGFDDVYLVKIALF